MAGLVSVGIAHLTATFTLLGKVEILEAKLEGKFELVNLRLDSQSELRRLDQQLKPSSFKLEAELDSLLSERRQYTRDMAELKGGLQVILQRLPEMKH